MKSSGKNMLFAAVICGCFLISLGQEMVPVHGHQLLLSCEGPSAGPTVILMAGGRGTIKIWTKCSRRWLHSLECAVTTGLASARAAPSKSHSLLLKIADDLAALLETAHVPTPYILVGHSI